MEERKRKTTTFNFYRISVSTYENKVFKASFGLGIDHMTELKLEKVSYCSSHAIQWAS